MPAIGQQLKKNILVEEREFMRMERKLKKIGPQGGRGWGTAIISKGQQLKKIFWRGTRIYANGTLIKENWSAGGRGW